MVQTESKLENQLIAQLGKSGWQFRPELNHYSLIVNHFRVLLNRRNIDKLDGTLLTDQEFQRFLNEIVGSKSIYQLGRYLRGDDQFQGGRAQIQRDDGSDITLSFFDPRDAENNIYEVAHQVVVNDKYENRYDVTLLINGLPLVQIELKRHSVEMSQAFQQILRYRRESFNVGGSLFRYLQIFVISNGMSSRYFSNNDGELNKNFIFNWSDENNRWIDEIEPFTASFLSPLNIHEMISKYTIFDADQKVMKIMRPYQVYAQKSIMSQAEIHPATNGYVWHTTGSGKTITAFKAASELALHTDAQKIIFLVDRRDLDSQTINNFNAYLPRRADGQSSIDRTDNTSVLVEQLKNSTDTLIVTTIQKLANAVKNPRHRSVLEPYKEQRVIFIEDEAHRTQFGEMRKQINSWFKNAQHFGFTGTPIFKENIGADGRTTDDIYDIRLHTYLIRDAVRDHNVLPFNVTYINTIHSKEDIENLNGEVEALNIKEVYENEKRLNQIAQHIILNHSSKTYNRQYNAIFAVSDTRTALKYYDIFKEINNDLKVTTIFTWAANEEDNDEHQKDYTLTSRHGLEKVIDDYNDKYHQNFSTDTFSDFFNDVSKRMKNHDAKSPENNIDVLIVVNMFLTGFDAPTLNTLYVDKNLQYHGLIQAFSRTNRVQKAPKDYGNIVAYRNIKSKTDEAVQLFSQGDKAAFFAPSYENLKLDFQQAISALRDKVATPEDTNRLLDEGETAELEFIKLFRNVMSLQSRISVYEEFDWAEIETELDWTQQIFDDFKGKYATFYERHKARQKEKASIIDDVDFYPELLMVDAIDVDYINRLISQIDLSSPNARTEGVEKVKKALTNNTEPTLFSKRELLEQFLDSVIPELNHDANITGELNHFLADKRQAEIYHFAEEHRLEPSRLAEQVAEYEVSQHENSKALSELTAGMTFKEKRTAKQSIKNFIIETAKKFVMN